MLDLFIFVNDHFRFPAQLLGFDPRRYFGQAVVTGVVPSPLVSFIYGCEIKTGTVQLMHTDRYIFTAVVTS